MPLIEASSKLADHEFAQLLNLQDTLLRSSIEERIWFAATNYDRIALTSSGGETSQFLPRKWREVTGNCPPIIYINSWPETSSAQNSIQLFKADGFDVYTYQNSHPGYVAQELEALRNNFDEAAFRALVDEVKLETRDLAFRDIQRILGGSIDLWVAGLTGETNQRNTLSILDVVQLEVGFSQQVFHRMYPFLSSTKDEMKFEMEQKQWPIIEGHDDWTKGLFGEGAECGLNVFKQSDP